MHDGRVHVKLHWAEKAPHIPAHRRLLFEISTSTGSMRSFVPVLTNPLINASAIENAAIRVLRSLHATNDPSTRQAV